MVDKVDRDRLRGDQIAPVKGPTLTDMVISLNDVGFKLNVRREKCRVSRKRKRSFYYEGFCPECVAPVKTESHRCHQEATRLAHEQGMCHNCGTAIVVGEIIASIEATVAAETVQATV